MSLCTLEINLSAIKNNYFLLQDICKTSLVGAAVKADGYGLGAVQISKALIEENCRHFFVASSEEGVNVRKALGIDVNILVLNGVFEHDALELIEYNLIPVLNNLKQIKVWQKFGNLKNRLLPCYLHFNTGINRLGLSSNEIEQLINNRDLLKGLNLQYIISHLAISEEIDNPYNLEQLNKFKAYLRYFPSTKASLANSGGIFLGQDYHFDLVRPGAALYGLKPLMQNPITLKAPIIHLQNLTLDSYIGYNMTFTTKRDSVIATLPLGYADGYSRNFSNQGEVFINGHGVPIVGRVSMDLINIDVTDLPPSDIFLGQEAEIIGNHCTPDKIASIIGTIGYEVLTSLGNRYRRKYTR
ncbi:MAG: alanine racemase [Rickettsia endosymbiont of Ixodes persulcatus]|nr:alanine racemase [Rickettsia endosymbiont of Ixodes persulcatus]MCZ6902244.1 alanine racemase [Rickettsia endosymbiont of Ixodes persulcatus]MCZ6903308.1 alanine racemase [Rickettsia endosymbiont of Ixodes persulcatus]MCZ6909346.1 alanine racemase [Rickettsia endosymbiont of Ixodes persulcatus]MCZ6911002.1 alanine racemase [Rickettsia endosymbiont of Ixodes persulcatus]